ncbi:MAG: AAA family ATPase [Acidimicrobiales bacterium]
MESVLCPVVVGRDAQLDVLGRRIDEIVDGHGGLIALVGEAGVGKSRLVREAAGMAEARGLVVLAGRSVPGDTPVPFRPLTEALMVAFRGGGPPDVPELAGFGGQLARLVPDWRAEPGGGADEAPLLVGEAVVRVLRLLGGGRGCLLILEDLHWGDPETLAVVEYLADTLTAEPVLCLLTARPGRSLAIHDLLERLRSRRAATLLPLMALDANEVEEMLASCLATKAVPPGVEQFMDSHSEGLPFLVGLAALPVALLWLAGAHALGGREADMEDTGGCMATASSWTMVCGEVAPSVGPSASRVAIDRPRCGCCMCAWWRMR